MKHPLLAGLVGIAAALTIASLAVAQSGKQDKPQLPPGMTEADMQACMQAATPGATHEQLAKSVGVWHGKSTMWMTPDAEPATSEVTSVFTPMMDGRFIKCEMTGDMPGMGPFSGFGISGYDSVSQTLQSTWIDNQSTGMMTGTGELSPDGGTLTWTFTFNCPVTKKATVMREVEHHMGNDSMTVEMFTTDPHSGKEFKMMEIASTRSGSSPPVGSAR